jgi:hypothetical protein
VSPASSDQLVIEAVEMIGPQSAEWHVADGRVDVAVDEPRVPVRGRGADVAALDRRPGVGEEHAETDGSSPRRRATDLVPPDVCGDLRGFFTVVAGGMPAPPFSAGERVDAVVGDDVDEVLALDDVCLRRSLPDRLEIDA